MGSDTETKAQLWAAANTAHLKVTRDVVEDEAALIGALVSEVQHLRSRVAEVEARLGEQVAVASWCTRVLDVCDGYIALQDKKADYARASEAMMPLSKVHDEIARAINDLREDIHGLPGWTGCEHVPAEMLSRGGKSD